MVISRECINNGCHNNTFRLKMLKERLIIECANCGYEQDEGNLNNWRPLPQCKCGCVNFRVAYDNADDTLDISCAKCGQDPIDGVEVEQKEVQSMSKTRRFLYDINKKLDILIEEQAELKYMLDENNNSLLISRAKCGRQPIDDINDEQEELQYMRKTQRFMHLINKKIDILIEEQDEFKDKLGDKLNEIYWETKDNDD